MPRHPLRLALQVSNPQHQPIKSSHLRVPPSPHSPLTPLHPPARLHLQILSPPPSTPNTLYNAPHIPYPWLWRCHLCRSIYRLGVTRRCLEDGHIFCSLPSPPTSDDEDTDHAKKPKHRHARGCRAEFDYSGWNDYNTWRREVHAFREESFSFSSLSSTGTTIREEQENCWADCEFPSECNHIRAERLKAARAAAKEARNIIPTISMLDQYQKLEAKEAEMIIQAEVDGIFSDTEEPADVPMSSLGEDERIVQAEHRVQEDEAKRVDVSLGDLEGQSFLLDNELLDDAGEVKHEFVEKKRKKSILKIHQLTGLMLGTAVDLTATVGEGSGPSSPLKMSINIEDEFLADREPDAAELQVTDEFGEQGPEVGILAVEPASTERRRSERLRKLQSDRKQNERDVQLEELVRVSGDFLRRTTGTECEEKFGDEDSIFGRGVRT